MNEYTICLGIYIFYHHLILLYAREMKRIKMCKM